MDYKRGDALIAELGNAILDEREIIQADWESLALIADLDWAPGVTRFTGFYFEGKKAHPFSIENDGLSELCTELRDVTTDEKSPAWKACLVQIERETGKFEIAFEHRDAARWRLTPDNFETLSAKLRPRWVAAKKQPKKKKASRAPKKSATGEQQEALDRLAETLASPAYLGRRPEALEVVWKKTVPVGRQAARVWLVNWRAGNDAFVGIAGPFEHSFLELSLDRLEPLKKSTRFRRLTNLYFGWRTCHLAEQTAGYADLPRLDARGLEAAFAAEETQVELVGSCITEGRELDADVGICSIERKRCRLECLEQPQAYIDPKGVRHYCVRAAIHYSYPDGTLRADYLLFFRADEEGKLKRASMRWMEPGLGGIYDELPLYHWVGSLKGPFPFGSRGRPALFDY